MADRELGPIVSRIRRMAAEVGGASDAELLRRFVASRDEAAFELLVWRHARLVFDVCRRILHDRHEAEDAFQATFLALARHAGRINRRQAVASWLHKVAYRAALAAKRHWTRRAVMERSGLLPEEIPAPPEAASALEQGDLRAALDLELSRLPERFRAPIVLCYLEGKTVEEAAVQLGCPRGTVASRLARGRERLRSRLARRGLALAAAVSATSSAHALPPYSLIPSLLAAGGHAASGAAKIPLSPQAAVLTEKVMNAMFLSKLKPAIATVLAVIGLLAVGGLAVHFRANAQSATPPIAAANSPSGAAGEWKSSSDRQDTTVAPPRQVAVIRPAQRKMTPSQDFTGRLEALRRVEVRAPVNGRLLKIAFKRGAEVKEGEILFEIDPTAYALAQAKAQANLAHAEARKKQTAAALQTARRLQQNNTLSQEDLDKAVAEAAVAEAAYRSAAVELERARLDLASTKVKAAVSGRVGRALVDAGNDVFSGRDRPTLLTSITTLDPIGLDFDMDQRNYLNYQRLLRDHEVTGIGSSISVGLAGDEGFRLTGTLEGFDHQFDPKFGTIRVRARMPNPNGLLVPGMFARVRVPFGKPRSAFEVPDDAVMSDQGRSYVLVVNDKNLVERRAVKRGPIVDEHGMRVIEDGLQSSDRVVTGKLAGLHPGDRVKVSGR